MKLERQRQKRGKRFQKYCSDNEAKGWKCDPVNCQARLQNDETALAVDVGYYLDFRCKR